MLHKNFARLSLLALFFIGLSSFVYKQQSQKVSPAPSHQIDGQKKFAQFLKLFPKKELPYVQDKTFLLNFFEEWRSDKENPFFREGSPYQAGGERISRDFDNIIPGVPGRGGFSRMGPDLYHAEQILRQSDELVAVLYSSTSPHASDKTYFVATFDAKGRFMGEERIGRIGAYYQRQCVFTIDKDLNIQSTHYKSQIEEEEVELQLAFVENFKINPYTGAVEEGRTEQVIEDENDLWNF